MKTQKRKVMDHIEKKPFSSKKFVAFFFCVLVLAGLSAIALLTQPIGWPLSAFMLAIVLTIGFIGVGFIFSVAQLDKYVRMAYIAAGRKFVDGDNDGDGIPDSQETDHSAEVVSKEEEVVSDAPEK